MRAYLNPLTGPESPAACLPPGNQLPGIDEEADLSDLGLLTGSNFCGALPVYADPLTIGRDGEAPACCYPPGDQTAWEDNIFDFLDNIDPVALEELSVPDVTTIPSAPFPNERGPSNVALVTGGACCRLK